jgi:hypothetical protein
MFPVVGREFGLVLDIITGAASNITYQAAHYVFLGMDEIIPNFALSSFREVFSVTYTNVVSQQTVIDTRGAHALAIEFTYTPPNPGGVPDRFNSGWFLAYASQTGSMTGARLIRVINTPLQATITRAVIPITSPAIILDWTAITPGNVTLTYSLLDDMPAYTPQFVSSRFTSSRVSPNPPVGTSATTNEDYLRGLIKWVRVQVTVAAGLPFEFRFLLQAVNTAGINTTDVWTCHVFNTTATISTLQRYIGRCQEFLEDVRFNVAGNDIYTWIFPADIWIIEKLRVVGLMMQPYINWTVELYLDQEVG